MDIDDQYLRELCNTLQDHPYLRPFRPNPKWFEARIFIVEQNPATPLRCEFESFDEYWHSLTRDPEAFDRRYREKHSSGQSKSTDRARQIQDWLHPVNVLITNAIIYPTRPGEKIPNKPKQKRIGKRCFEYLLNVCKPYSVLFCGAKAVELASKSLGVELDRYQAIECQGTVIHDPCRCHLFAYHHLTGQGLRRGSTFNWEKDLKWWTDRMKKLETQF